MELHLKGLDSNISTQSLWLVYLALFSIVFNITSGKLALQLTNFILFNIIVNGTANETCIPLQNLRFSANYSTIQFH